MAHDYGGTPPPAMEESASRMNEQPPAAMTVETVTIKPVANGFVVQVSKRATGGDTSAPAAYQPPKEYAFTTVQEALRHATQVLGGTPAEPEEAREVMA